MINKPYTKTWLKYQLQKIKNLMRRLDEEDKHLEAIVGGYPHTGDRPGWEGISLAIEMLSMVCNDQDDFISWFIWDNNWGQDKKEVHLSDGKVIVVNGVARLWDVLQHYQGD